MRLIFLVLVVAAVAVAPAGATARRRSDLVVVRARVSGATLASGARFAVRDTVTNRGASARASVTRYFVLLDHKRVRLGSRRVPQLRRRKSSAGVGKATLPKSIAAGSYRLVICADATRRVKESNERNNCLKRGTVHVGAPQQQPQPTPPQTPPPPPPAPTGVSAAAAASNEIDLNWSAVSSATSYNVFRSTSPGSGYAQVGTRTDTTFTDFGVSASHTYYYVIKTVSGASTSAASAEESAITPAATFPGYMASPSVSCTTTPTSKDATVNFAAAAGADSYVVGIGTSPDGGFSTSTTPTTATVVSAPSDGSPGPIWLFVRPVNSSNVGTDSYTPNIPCP